MAAGTLQQGLMQSVSPRPGQPEVIRVFPAWPKKWEASFRLLARGGFLVTSSIRNGEVEFVEIESRLGEECRLRNPWGGPCLLSGAGAGEGEAAADGTVPEGAGEGPAGDSLLEEKGDAAGDGTQLEGDLLRFETAAGQRYRIRPQRQARPAGHDHSP